MTFETKIFPSFPRYQESAEIKLKISELFSIKFFDFSNSNISLSRLEKF